MDYFNSMMIPTIGCSTHAQISNTTDLEKQHLIQKMKMAIVEVVYPEKNDSHMSAYINFH